MAITTLDGLIAAMPGQMRPLIKSFTVQSVSSYHAMWLQPGIPGAPSAPSPGVAGEIPTDATAGALPFTNPGGGGLSYLGRLAVTGTINGTVMLFDRLWHNSGLSPTTPIGSAQTVSSVALTRPDALGAQAEAWLEVYTTLGSSTTAPTISYTDQDGNATQTGTLLGFVTAAAAGRTFPFQLASGDTGVRSIQSFTLAATFTSGTYGLVIRRRLAMVNLYNNTVGNALDPITSGLPRIYDDACLELVCIAPATGANIVHGNLAIVQG